MPEAQRGERQLTLPTRGVTEIRARCMYYFIGVAGNVTVLVTLAPGQTRKLPDLAPAAHDRYVPC